MNDSFKLHLELTIRPCVADDVPKLEWFGLYTAHREIIRDAFDRHERGDNVMLVADLKGFPVAQVWIDLARFRPDSVGLLWALRVFPCLQRLGIGRKMLRAAEETLVERGYEQAEIGVRKGARAADLYARLGYQHVGERHEHYSYTTPEGRFHRVPVDQWILRKTLIRPGNVE